MNTWEDEFIQLSNIEREAIEIWKANPKQLDDLIAAKEATNRFLKKYRAAGCPPHSDKML